MTMHLTRAEVAQVIAGMRPRARPLDILVWQVAQAQQPWQAAVPVLTTYQNPDGGFGHGIEPDVWHPASSPLATTVALQYAHTLGIPVAHELWQRALRYLIGAYDTAAGKWHPMAAGVNAYPHAPWWHADEQTGQNSLDKDWPNPSVEIIGYLQAHVGEIGEMDHWYAALLEYVVRADTIESHALACYVRAYPWLPKSIQTRIFPHLVRLLRQVIHPTPADWLVAYVPTPLDYVTHPQAPFADQLADMIDVQLDQWCLHVRAHGSWVPTWQWGQYADAWTTAQQWWTGKMTVERLLILERFGRIV